MIAKMPASMMNNRSAGNGAPKTVICPPIAPNQDSRPMMSMASVVTPLTSWSTFCYSQRSRSSPLR